MFHHMKEFTFFWGGTFSNWKIAPMTIDGIEFNCVEQYMMYMKAKTFGDELTAKKIMIAEHPSEHKKLGRQVKDFKAEKWDEVKDVIVERGLREKYLQNPVLKEELMKTDGTLLVEASPNDSIWGIGFSETQALKNRGKWGLNLLGKLSTKVREDLKKESK